MKNMLIIALTFFIIYNLFASIIISISGLLNDSYFNEYYNYTSFKDPQSYMEIDTFLLCGVYNTDLNLGSSNIFIINGILQSDKSEIKIVVGNEKYFDYTLDKYPLYSNPLTNDYFLKNAPEGYYKRQNRSFLGGMYLKLSLLPLIGLTIYVIRKYRSLI